MGHLQNLIRHAPEEVQLPTPPLAKPAKPANREVITPTKPPTLATLATLAGGYSEIRIELLEVARPEGIDPTIIHALPDIELQATAEQLAQCEPDKRNAIVLAYIRALRDTAERETGHIPPGPHAMALCRHCGAVWIASDVVAVLPVVEGVARCLGCPWCHVRIAGGYIPRPKVTCAGCKHFTPDTVNPAGGLGTCASGHKARFPNEQHRCSEWRPKNEHGK